MARPEGSLEETYDALAERLGAPERGPAGRAPAGLAGASAAGRTCAPRAPSPSSASSPRRPRATRRRRWWSRCGRRSRRPEPVPPTERKTSLCAGSSDTSASGEVAPLLIAGAEAPGVPRLRLGRGRGGGGREIQVRKEAGKIAELEKLLERTRCTGVYGIGHTRWATHGAPTDHNAHPHTTRGRRLRAGAQRDHRERRDAAPQAAGAGARVLLRDRHRGAGAPDRGGVQHAATGRAGESLERAVETALAQVEGTYGIAVVSTRDPGKIVAARLGSPLLIGVGADGETFVASDAAAVIAHTRDVVYLDDGDMATITSDGLHRPPPRAGAGEAPGEPGGLGPGRGGARRLRALHAQGDHGAAADAARDHARPAAGGGGHGQARRPHRDGRGAAATPGG